MNVDITKAVKKTRDEYPDEIEHRKANNILESMSFDQQAKYYRTVSNLMKLRSCL